jgi:hypothetical protein
MVDLAIASNFARELTEEQFAEGRGRRTPRRRAAAGAAIRPTAEAAVRPRGRADAAVQPAAPARPARSAFARLMSRLVQVRG